MSEEDLKFYIENRQVLSTSEGNDIAKSSPNFPVGLINHGATCYLNSILQCLYHCEEFRKAIMSTNDENSSQIVTELKRLFVFMGYSTKGALPTKNLLDAFGWSRSQVHEQNDVHEFFTVLIDSLGVETPFLNGKTVPNLLQGVSKDALSCSTCNFQSDKESTFINISLDVVDTLESVSGEDTNTAKVDIHQMLAKQLLPETLDDDNMWECTKCAARVKATKQLSFQSFPKILVCHLKRFRFDPTTKKKRKLTSPILIPMTLAAASVIDGAASQYELSSLILHTGSSSGGHYRAYAKSVDGIWRDYNDANVSDITLDADSRYFQLASLNGDTTGINTLVEENVYMVTYRMVTDAGIETNGASMEDIKSLISSDMMKALEEDNVRHTLFIRLQELSKSIVDLQVFSNVKSFDDSTILALASSEDEIIAQNLSISLIKTDLVSTTKERLYKEFQTLRGSTGDAFPLNNCRLRKYNRSTKRMGETYGGDDESKTLGDTVADDLWVPGSPCVLMLEFRTDTDPVFVDYNPKDMRVFFSTWSSAVESSLSTDGLINAPFEVVVPGQQAATVGALRATLSTQLHIPSTRLVLIRHGSIDCTITRPQILEDDTRVLMEHHGIHPGASIVLDVIPEGSEEGFVSTALSVLENHYKTIIISFNNPFATDADAYTLSVRVSLDDTLGSVKDSIAKVTGQTDLSSFHLKRNANGVQFKDENKTMNELAFVTGSIVHLQKGVGCKIGEHVLLFELDVTPTAATPPMPEGQESDTGNGSKSPGNANNDSSVVKFVPLSDMIVSEALSVLQLKTMIFNNWSTLTAKLTSEMTVEGKILSVPPPSFRYIRIRDYKGSKLSGPLRDDRLLHRCLLGLCDGRRIGLQILDHEEYIGPDDIIITLRMASYEKKKLSMPLDLPVVRSSTIGMLYKKIIELFPHLNESPPDKPATPSSDPSEEEKRAATPSNVAESKVVSIAKGFSTGPPLSLKNALKLKWNDPAVLANSDAALDKPPLNLRDGSVIVVRGNADFLRACELTRIKKAAELEAQSNEPQATGGGFAYVRAKSRSSSRSGSRSASKRGGAGAFHNQPKEKALQFFNPTDADGSIPPAP